MFGHLLLNVILAGIWCFLLEDFRPVTFVIGYGISVAILFVLRRVMGEIVFFKKLRVFLSLMVEFTRQIVVANLQVAWWILRPRLHVQPAMIRLPIILESDAAITALAGMISLTPGTLSVDVSPDRKELEVHCLNVPDVAAAKQSIKDSFERPLRELEQ